MKIKFLIGIILVIGIVFQFFRINELHQIVDVVSIRNSKEVHYTSAKEIPASFNAPPMYIIIAPIITLKKLIIP